MVKSIAMLLLINIALVSIVSTSAGYWFTRKSGNFSGMYEKNSESTFLYGIRSSLVFGDNKVNDRITVRAVADNYMAPFGKATYGITYDTSVPDNGAQYPGSAQKSYRVCTSVTIKGTMSGGSKHISITVKLIYFAGGQVDAAVYRKSYYSASSLGNTYLICTGGHTLSSSRDLYVEVTVDVYTYADLLSGRTTVDVFNNGGYIKLNSWEIQEYNTGGPM